MNEDAIHPLRGIALKVLHVAMYMVMLAIIKTIEGLPTWELMFFRTFFAILPIAIYLLLRGELVKTLETRRHFGHLLRTILALTTMGMTFIAIHAIPLPEAVTLQYTQPMFVVALSAILLHQRVGAFRWVAVAFGFFGALVIMWPKLTLLSEGTSALSQQELIGAVAALAGAAALALNLLMVGQLVRTEKSTTIALWFGIYSTVLLALTIPFGWVVPSPVQFVLLILTGLIGGIALLIVAESLRAAPAAISAPFEYSSLIFASVLGYFMFGDRPTGHTLAGGGLLILAGLTIIWRERREKRVQSTAVDVSQTEETIG